MVNFDNHIKKLKMEEIKNQFVENIGIVMPDVTPERIGEIYDRIIQIAEEKEKEHENDKEEDSMLTGVKEMVQIMISESTSKEEMFVFTSALSYITSIE